MSQTLCLRHCVRHCVLAALCHPNIQQYHQAMRFLLLSRMKGCLKLRSYSTIKSLHKEYPPNLIFQPRIWRKAACFSSSSSKPPGSDDVSSQRETPVKPTSVVEEVLLEKSQAKPLNAESITVVKVQPTLKMQPPKVKRQKIDLSQSYTDNIYITPMRAMKEYLLDSSDFDKIATSKRRSPYPERPHITVFLRRDVEKKSIEKWGSMEAVQKELQKRRAWDSKVNHYDKPYSLPNKTQLTELKARKQYYRDHAGSDGEKAFIFNAPSPPMQTESIFKTGPGKVVVYAIAVNGVNCIMKLAAWLYTGSHSMFSEFIHSMADTANQLLLAYGLHQSAKKPDITHPYGWASFRNVSSLISGVGIFCVGAGLSWYHGIMGLLHPDQIHSLFWAIAILGGSFISEGATCMVAINEVRQSARKCNMSPVQYVFQSQDPSTNVVLLEDLAAVMGVTIAAGCMSITYFTGNPMADAVGSLMIGTLLGGVASFIIYTNTIMLVGKSIPEDQRQLLMKELESDRMIRALHDVKATSVGANVVRFKAEVDFDGTELTKYYLEKQDLEHLMKEIQAFSTIEELEIFMLKHGENLVDTLGGEVDRIEKNLKRKHPEIRHVDLEQL